jgi:nucleoside-diphosphate-sugar epimerase
VLREVRPDTVFHLAGFAMGSRELPAVLRSLRDDLTTTVNLLVASCEIRCRRVILAGSLEEPIPGEPGPASPYAASKSAATAYARMFFEQFGLPVITARIFMTYGPGQRPEKLLPYVIDCLLNQQQPRIASPHRMIDWIYVDDLAEGLLQLALADDVEGQIVDLGSGQAVSVMDTVAEIARQLKVSCQPCDTFEAAGRREVNRVAAAATTRAKIGWHASTSLPEGLERTIRWRRLQAAGIR